jgi:hypothetical protein
MLSSWREDAFWSSKASNLFSPQVYTPIFPRSLCELYAYGTSYEEIHEQVRHNYDKWSRYVPDTTFKFSVTGYANAIPQERQREVINSFRWMNLEGKIDMKHPEVTFVCHEECGFYRSFWSLQKPGSSTFGYRSLHRRKQAPVFRRWKLHSGIFWQVGAFLPS